MLDDVVELMLVHNIKASYLGAGHAMLQIWLTLSHLAWGQQNASRKPVLLTYTPHGLQTCSLWGDVLLTAGMPAADAEGE